MNRTQALALACIPVLALTACSSPTSGPVAPTSDASAVTLRIELWDEFETLADGGCRVDASAIDLPSIERGQSVALVGPNDDELSAAAFGPGTMQPTVETDSSYWSNLPTQDVCVFEADFNDVPVVGTYRAKFRVTGIEDISYERSFVEDSGGQMVMIFGGEVTD